VEVRSLVEPQQVGLIVQAHLTSPDADPNSAATRSSVSLEISAGLAGALGGALHLETSQPGEWKARLLWPKAAPDTLLVVDDNEGLVELFRRYLVGLPWQVVGAASGAEARQHLTQVHPTVVIMDIMLPGEDGWELLMAFKADEATRDIPVIICSVQQEPALAQSLGAAAYLPKPVTQSDLVRALSPWSSKNPTRASVH
jgi:CheY-like chemotaxis protein